MISPRLKSNGSFQPPSDSHPAISTKVARAETPRPKDSETTLVLPATLAQRRFWLLDKLKPGGNPALHMSLPMRLRGPLDLGALRRALQELGARHEALRTTFVSARGELRQAIAPAINLDLAMVEKSRPPAENDARFVDCIIRAEAQRPFDLATGPLVRARLIRFDKAEHLLLLVLHHIISDGWSNGLLARELWTFYEAFAVKQAPPLPPLRLQFADYAHWQQERLAANDFVVQREYWRRQLAGDLPVLDLPTDRPRARTQTGASDVRARRLAPELVRSAKTFAAREGASSFMFFLALFQALLHRYTGQTDFLITSPSANRQREEFESLIGPFVNPLLLRADLRADPSFRELLGRVRSVAMDALENQDVPLELLLDEFHSSRLQVNFLYQSASFESTLSSGLLVEPLSSPSVGTIYELSAAILDDSNGVRLELEYDTGLFDAETIERMLGHYETLLGGALADPAKSISTLPLLTKAERHQLGLDDHPIQAPLSSPASVALCEWAHLDPGERVVSFSPPGVAVEEELGAVRLARAVSVAPPPELLRAAPAVLVDWLEREEIAVAFLPAATWHRLATAFPGKATKPAKLRCVIATEGAPREGSFARVSAQEDASVSIRVCSRRVLAKIGTVAFDGKPLLPAGQLQVVDPHSGEPLPIGVPGQLVINDGKNLQATAELARWSRAGVLERLGNVTEQVYARGFRLDLRQSETALGAMPGIRHALVRAFGQEKETALVAYITPQPAAAALPSAAALRQSLREKGLPDELIPVAFVRLKEIPVRASDGRLDLSALPERPSEPTTTAESVRPYLGLQLQLIAIWKDILGLSELGIRDDFFDLGGNSLLAIRMLQRAEVACGREILPTSLFHHATIEHLADEIAHDVMRDSPALVHVKDAGNLTPFFYLHGDFLGGGFYSLKLSRALGPEQPFYVLPPYDIRSATAAPSIEEMASAHAAALRAVRPKGPYIIGGFCIGGVVAYELARQLEAGGDKVEMLLILDAIAQDKSLRVLRSVTEKLGALFHWDDAAKLAHFGKWAGWHARMGGLARAPGTVVWLISIALRRIYNRLILLCSTLLPRVKRGTGANDQPPRERDVRATFLWASAGYRPQPYHAPVALLLSEDVLPENMLASDWQHLAPNIVIHPLRGSHLECITTHVDILAEKIKSCLQMGAAHSVSQK
jgi:hypothetical protein